MMLKKKLDCLDFLTDVIITHQLVCEEKTKAFIWMCSVVFRHHH